MRAPHWSRTAATTRTVATQVPELKVPGSFEFFYTGNVKDSKGNRETYRFLPPPVRTPSRLVSCPR